MEEQPMNYFKTTAKCPECNLTFDYAVTQEEMDDGTAMDIPCPTCGEPASFDKYNPCSEETYEEIIEAYEEKMDESYDLDYLEEEDFEEEWD
jgi:peptide subunit release factor 1 (eRF1)